MSIKRVEVIINPASGRDRPVLSTLNSAFTKAGIDWDVSITKAAGDASRLAKAAAASGVDAVAVYGGDGTITEAAAGLMGSDMPLVIFPGGTANAIALALGVPADLEEACALVSGDYQVRTVDMGQVGDRYFLIAIGIGIPGTLAEQADRGSKDRLGFLAYALSTIQALGNEQVARYRMTLDGKQAETEGVMCVVANSGNFGLPGLSLASTIDMSDGLLDVLVIRKADLTSVLSVAASVVRQDDAAAPFERWQAREIEVVSDPPQAIQADGEVLEPGQITARVLPCAAHIIVPRGMATT